MSLNNISSAELRRLISIVERKERVQEELREIESKLSTYVSEPTIASTRTLRRVRKSRAVRASKQVKAAKAKLQQAESKSSARRGALKDALLAALQKADGAGIAIKDLSKALGVKAQTHN